MKKLDFEHLLERAEILKEQARNTEIKRPKGTGTCTLCLGTKTFVEPYQKEINGQMYSFARQAPCPCNYR